MVVVNSKIHVHKDFSTPSFESHWRACWHPFAFLANRHTFLFDLVAFFTPKLLLLPALNLSKYLLFNNVTNLRLSAVDCFCGPKKEYFNQHFDTYCCVHQNSEHCQIDGITNARWCPNATLLSRNQRCDNKCTSDDYSGGTGCGVFKQGK